MQFKDTTLEMQLTESIRQVKENKMNGTNGFARADVGAPALVATANNSTATHNGNTTKPAAFTFRKAVKYDAKLRMALAGPGGSGKTYTLLKLATELGGRIAVVDTEHGSASKYADEFSFEVLELDSFDPGIVPALIAEVAAQGFSTLIIDSLSHFWNGNNGELDQVDQISARSRSGNSFAAWRQVSPKHNAMVDAMISAPIHILVSMRVKTEWVVEKDDKGKSVPRKVGMQPIMRDGIEYEFDVCGDMDQENNMIVTKSRCSTLAGKVCGKPGREVALVLRSWLASPDPKPVTMAPAPTAAPPTGTIAAAAQVAEQKIASGNPQSACPWTTFGEMKRIFAELREKVGEVEYLQEMERHGWKTVNDIRSKPMAIDCYHHLLFLAERAEELRKEVA